MAFDPERLINPQSASLSIPSAIDPTRTIYHLKTVSVRGGWSNVSRPEVVMNLEIAELADQMGRSVTIAFSAADALYIAKLLDETAKHMENPGASHLFG